MGLLQSIKQLPLVDKLLRREEEIPEPGPSRAATSCAEVRSLLEQGEFDEAEKACRDLLNLYPDSLEGLTLAFRLALSHGSYRSALRYLENGVRLRPDTAELSFMLGYLHLKNRTLEVAASYFGKTLELDPQAAQACNGLGMVAQLSGRDDEALQHFQTAHELDPQYWRASYNIARLTQQHGRLAEAVGPFQQALFARRGYDATQTVIDLDDPLVTHSKLTHDAQQLDYLAQRKLLDHRAWPAQKVLSEAVKASGIEPGQTLSHIAEPMREKLAPWYNRLLHFHNAPALPGGALNQDQDWAAIAGAYVGNGQEATYFDNFLKPEALESMRRFCLESTVWFDFAEHGGHLRCTLEDGFISPLIAQIVEETRQALADVLGEHRLIGLIGTKDDTDQERRGPHANDAAIGLHVWLSSDDDNLSAETGGMLIWGNEGQMASDDGKHAVPATASEGQSGAPVSVMPHKQNRAVLYRADLPHCSDACHFKAGYESRRTAVTMLFGSKPIPKS